MNNMMNKNIKDNGHIRQRIFMLGAGFMQGVAIRAAHALGCTVIAADGNPQAVCAKEADEFVHIDLKDTERLIEYAQYLQRNGGLDGVFTAATDFSAAVAAIAETCGLRGHCLSAALNATDKVRMRECFRKHGVPSPRFAELTAVDISASALPEGNKNLMELMHCFPLVVKPVDNMGARGCKLVQNAAGLQEAAATAMSYSRSSRVIVEECIEGSEFSIEGLIFNGKIFITALADRHIFFPPYFIEMGHTIPSDCSQAIADEVISVFEQGVRALGLSDGAVKGDILVRNGKAFVGEIAARLSGGYMSGWTVPYSSGLDITAAALTLALGGTPHLASDGNNHFVVPLKQHSPFVSAERAWISIPGQIASISGLEAAKAIPFVKAVFPRVLTGDSVVFPQNNVEKCGNVLSAAPTRTLAVQASETACRQIVLRLKPHCAETDAFLSVLHPLSAQLDYPPNMLQFNDMRFSTVEGSSFEKLIDMAIYEEKEGFFLPDFLAASFDSAHDIQGRTLKELLEQALVEEPELTSILCKVQPHSADMASSTIPAKPVPCCKDSYTAHTATIEKNEYWKALIRGGLQGLLYRYDCNHT